MIAVIVTSLGGWFLKESLLKELASLNQIWIRSYDGC